MNTKRYQLENYRKYLLNRVTASQHFTQYIEDCLVTDDAAAHHSFHKIMVHNWTGNSRNLFETLAEYFSPTFIPVNFATQGAVSSFYTCSLSLVLKITKLDFMFPHQRNMYNIDILFNDKTSADCFENRVTIEDIVSGVVSNRFSDKFELDLTDFCNDPEFLEKKIHFYKLHLLSHFKILMLRMGRDTRSLNLSNNNLSQVPTDILNFFIKGDLISINFSNNEIPSLQELQRVSSKIENLWLEGNPLCEEVDAMEYVKDIAKKFPRITHLDGIKINEHGFLLPFHKNFFVTPNKKTEMLVEKFLCLYFANYDTYPRNTISMFYAPDAKLSLVPRFTDEEKAKDASLEAYLSASIVEARPERKARHTSPRYKLHHGRATISQLLLRLPQTEHDPATFTVDVIGHDKKGIIMVVDGIYREKTQNLAKPYKYFNFRRTFIFGMNVKLNTTTTCTMTEYLIQHEIFSLSLAPKEMIDGSFKTNSRSTNQLALHNPEKEDCQALCNIFTHITGLKLSEAELRLKSLQYDILGALNIFLKEIKDNQIGADRFAANEDEDFSDSSTLLEDDVD